MESTNFPLLLTDNDTYSYYENYWITRDVVDRVTSVSQPSQGGSVAIMPNGQGVLYSAPAGFEGEETFEYMADGKHPATVTVHVTRPVRDDFFWQKVYEDTVENVLDVLQNDFKGNGYDGAGLITMVSETSGGGTVRLAQNGRSLFYTPAVGFRGIDSFSYTVDGAVSGRSESRRRSSRHAGSHHLLSGMAKW